MEVFKKSDLKKLKKPKDDSSNEDNGQVTIIGGSSLFHGAPILSLKTASRFADMVFFATPEESVGRVAERAKAKLLSFIWVPWEEVGDYIAKSDAVLIGPGFMRYRKEKDKPVQDGRDKVGEKTRKITKDLLSLFPEKKWVIDAGSLQVMDEKWIPEGSVITPNSGEFELLFKCRFEGSGFEITKNNVRLVSKKAGEHNCVIVVKGPETLVCSSDRCVVVLGGNPGMTKGGTGDVLAGLACAFLAQNEAFLAACAASYVLKAAGDSLHEVRGIGYNADDLAEKVPETFSGLLK